MNKTVIKAEVVADSLSPKGDRLTSLRITFPRIILAEVNTHRMLSKNTSSSRAIPFKKMVEAVQNDPFIPIAWQKNHSGMQGTEYITDKRHCNLAVGTWIMARDEAVKRASELNSGLSKLLPNGESKVLTNIGVTKQLTNRLLEPFMWTTMLITGSKEGWDNFFRLRCPQYEIELTPDNSEVAIGNSWKELMSWSGTGGIWAGDMDTDNIVDRLQFNKGHAEIHMMALAEAIYDAMNESTPKQLKAGEWHIPFGDNFDKDKVAELYYEVINNDRPDSHISSIEETKIKISTARCARLSYMTFDGEIDYEKDLKLHDTLLESQHMSPFEHCARAMSNEEYQFFIKGKGIPDYSLGISSSNPVLTFRKNEEGWCNNIKGFIPYRYMIDNNLKM